MTIDLESRPMPERFQHLLALISSERFLKRQSLNNEIPFFICPFKPEEAVDMARMQKQLINRLTQMGIRILEINLYDMAMNILRSRDIWKQIHEVESTVSKDQIKELLQGVLDSENHLIPEIGARMSRAEFDVLFITGVGEVFPYIRSHNVLNNLQSTAKEKPTVMFFPGAYTYSLEQGASLDLFGRLHDDKYYRAFNIFHCEI
jgi:hypothetical protein